MEVAKLKIFNRSYPTNENLSIFKLLTTIGKFGEYWALIACLLWVGQKELVNTKFAHNLARRPEVWLYDIPSMKSAILAREGPIRPTNPIGVM